MSEDSLTKFVVHWQTQIGPGSTFYKGKESVWAENSDAAQSLAKFNVWRRAFPEYGMRHIVITQVEEA